MVAKSTIGVGMIGCGTVGGGVAQLLDQMADVYTRRLGVQLELRRILVRDAKKTGRQSAIDAALLTTDAEAFFATPGLDIIVEVAGTVNMLDHVRRALNMGKPVVTANKSLLAAHGPALFALARKHGVAIGFEASCMGGVPIITALQFGLTANRIDALYGILNGTCNYILTEMTQKGKDYETALAEAQHAGYAETDPTMDVSGRDSAEKLAILASLAFDVTLDGDAVSCQGIEGLEQTDIHFARELGYEAKLLAVAQRVHHSSGPDQPNDDAGAQRLSLRVHPCFIHADHLLAAVHGSFNALSVYGHATGQTMYYGRGAGASPTASAVVSDLLNTAAGGCSQALAGLHVGLNGRNPLQIIGEDELTSRFYLRMTALDGPGVMAAITGILGCAQIGISAVLQHESAVGQLVPLVVLTHSVRQGAVTEAVSYIEKLEQIHGRCMCLPILDLPEA